MIPKGYRPTGTLCNIFSLCRSMMTIRKLIWSTAYNVNPSLLNFLEDKDRYLGLSEGTRGALVWELQKMLIEKGFNLQKDGVYSLETRTQIMAFQNANDLYPSGRLNAMTFDKLFLNR